MQISKPMLAGKCSDIRKLRYPVLATPKLDGIRCLIVNLNGQKRCVSRNFKPIPNHYVREMLQEICPVGFDGELVVPGGTFQETSSAIMSRDGVPEFEYQVFDWVLEDSRPYSTRVDYLGRKFALSEPQIKLVLPEIMTNVEELEQYERECLELSYEGVMVRSPDSPYKCGRSTEREGYLLKIKRFEDGDARIVGVEEKMHNDNPAELDELGRTKHSSHKANQVPTGTLGSLIVRDCITDVQFKIGSGFDDYTRQKLWETRGTLFGKIVKYKSQPSGVKDKPRFPIFLGFRSSL
jgi:DNA ligase 1